MENHTAISLKNSPSYANHPPRKHSQGSRKQLSSSYAFFTTPPLPLLAGPCDLLTTFHNCAGSTVARLLGTEAKRRRRVYNVQRTESELVQ